MFVICFSPLKRCCSRQSKPLFRYLKPVILKRSTCRSLSSEASSIANIQTLPTSEEYDYSNAKPFSDIPGPKGLPYIGTMLQYRWGPFKIARMQDALWERYTKYGPIMKEMINGHTAVHLFHPEFVKTYYLHEEKLPDIPPLLETAQMYRKQRNLSPGLGNTNGEEWYRLRSAVQQMMMRPKEVTAYFPYVTSVADDFVERITNIRDDKGEVCDFRNEVSKWTLESSGITCFEDRLGCLSETGNPDAQKMIDANLAVFEISTQLKFSLPLHKFFPTPMWKKLMDAEDCILNFGLKHTNQTIAKIDDLEKTKQLSEDNYIFMSYLLSRKELSYKDICIISQSLFSDGLSTTSPMLIFNLYCLAKNPDVQEKLYREIELHQPDDEPLTLERLNKMSYVKACVKETFRFFPVGLDISRLTTKNMVIGGYQIPAGTRIDMNNFVMAQLPEYFPEPEKYIPERWIKDGSAQNIHPYIMIPFGHGPRMCAGRRFAEQELYVLLAKLVKRFHIKWHHGDMSQKYQVLMVPDKPAQFTFVTRK